MKEPIIMLNGELDINFLELMKKVYQELSEEKRMEALKEYEEFKANLFK
jgi:hypothetical protein